MKLSGNWPSLLAKVPGLKVIILKYNLRLKIKRNDWLFADMCPQAANHCALCVRKQSIIALYFESEKELKLYNLEASLPVS